MFCCVLFVFLCFFDVQFLTICLTSFYDFLYGLSDFLMNVMFFVFMFF